MKSFIELGLDSNIVDALEKQGITEPTEIQHLTIEKILENKDVIAESYTGSGKTLAFLCPIFQKVNSEKREMQVLVLAPTHELVMQIEAQAKLLASNGNLPITSLPIIGDVNIEKQIKKLKEIKPHIIVATPGRALDLMKKKKITAHTIKTIVIDEGDNLLDNTNSGTVKDIIKCTMRDRCLLVFSATISPKVLFTARELMKEPEIIKNEKKAALNPNIKHMYIEVDPRDKVETLRKLISAVEPKKALVFVNRGYEVDLATEKLNYHSIPSLSIHKKVTKEQRQKAIESFRSGKIKVLVSSDVSARGLDIQDITHVINLDFPTNASEYLHRAGRTARAGATGKTISLVTSKEMAAIRIYEREFNINIEKKNLSHGKLN
ncbi:superfamily II DNA and RNA helicase [Clostridium cylindrosporum DSM 605]|uniref:Superfamily II DNA and RNA helicase n=2 Tax=Clostridium cylindrosporum TaxID=1495 RepID=A0A0J8DCU6_CLOCY|nr:superfamily II DNA and RNA helicase [Clostridium cylindrosporum DSM 605]